MRPLSYPGTNCFVVCFSLVDKQSFKNACSIWRNELDQLGPSRCPKLLCGLKSDLRDEFQNTNKTDLCVTTEEGNKARDEYNFQGYVECSAKTNFNLNKVFFTAQRIHFKLQEIATGDQEAEVASEENKDAIVQPEKKKKFCSVL